MHYKNGREAKNGDLVIWTPDYPRDESGKRISIPVIGVLYNAVAGNDHCNGRIASTSTTDPYPNLKEVLHIDDMYGDNDTLIVLHTRTKEIIAEGLAQSKKDENGNTARS